jgi:L-2-hydroxyglutarate oxidase LhgO
LKSHGVPYKKCGKLIVCTDPLDLPRLESIRQHAVNNGVLSLQLISGEDVRTSFNSRISCSHALWSPDTGILDSHAYADNLEYEVEQAQSIIAYQCDVQSVKMLPVHGPAKWKLETNHGSIYCDKLVNSAGLFASYLAYKIDSYPKVSIALS